MTLILKKGEPEQYWLQHLRAPLPIMTLPSELSRPLSYTHRYEEQIYSISQDDLDTIETLCQERNLSLPIFLLATYIAFVYRLTHEEEILIGMYQASQDEPLLPLRISLVGMNRFSELLERVSEYVEMAYSYPCPPEFFQEHIFVQQEASRPTMYSMVFATTDSSEHVNAESELLWTAICEQEKLNLHLQYNPLIYADSSATHFLDLYGTLLAHVAVDPDVSFRTVSILAADDLTLYTQLNQTETPYSADFTIPDKFYEVAAQYPEHIAVSSDEKQLTYAELDDISNQVANMLLTYGLRTGQFVAIFLERSVETLVSLMGIMKAGGAYIPIDPDYPADRVQYIVSDSQAAYVLTNAQHVERATEMMAENPEAPPILRVDQLSDYSSEKPVVSIQPDDLAYVIYTSGSTGRPKGTLLRHRGVLSLATWAEGARGLTPYDTLAEFASYSFDASVYDTFAALLVGGRLHLLSQIERLSVEHFADAVERIQATIIPGIPTVFYKQMALHLSDDSYRKLATVRCITVAGEALTGEIVRLWQRRFGMEIGLLNAYGPTECTVCATAYEVPDWTHDERANVPIGTPIYNFKAHILSPDNQLCPINVAGELCLETVGIAVGYHKQPEKTAEVFVPNPFSDNPKDLIYRTGDIVKLLPNGTIEYLGRKDNQVKIRGFRVEISEIEDVFAKHVAVQEVAVIVKKDEHGNAKLIGYYTTKPETDLTPEMARSFLGEQLPDFMTPELIVKLDSMPLSPSGKIDRKVLEKREDQPAPSTATFIPLETVEQQLIADSWQKILGVERIGLHDDFFSLGGHSLLVIQVLVLLKPHFPNLKIQDFFDHRTVELLADYAVTHGTVVQEKKRPKHWAIKDLVEGSVLTATVPYRLITKMPEHIFLTGVTGYLGAHLLDQLIRQTDAHIYCMVRPSSNVWDRLMETATFYFEQHIIDQLISRVTPIAGDLGAEGLGMSAEDLQLLKDNVDSIIHAAADVRHFGDPEQFDRVNIRGTELLLDIARSRKGIRFHHVSTISVPEELASQGQWERFKKIKDYNFNVNLENVYSNSKLQAEKVIRHAIRQGVPVTIYRAGNLVCHSKTGKFQRNIDGNAFYRMMKAVLSLNATPDAQMYLDLTPIDYASQAIVRLACQTETMGRTFHIVNPEQITYKTFIDLVNSLGYAIKVMDPEEYERWLFTNQDTKNQEILQLAIAQLEGDGVRDSEYRFNCPDTNKFLAYTSVLCERPERHFIFKLINYAVKIGYFPPSEQWEEIVKELGDPQTDRTQSLLSL